MSTITRKPASDKGNTRIHLFDLSELNVSFCVLRQLYASVRRVVYIHEVMFTSLKRLNLSTPARMIYISLCIHHFVFILVRVIYTLVHCLSKQQGLDLVKWAMIYCLLLQILRSRCRHAS